MSEFLRCPFCGARPKHGDGPKRSCQLHGDEHHDYRVWCGTNYESAHARAELPSRELAAKVWNTRAET